MKLCNGGGMNLIWIEALLGLFYMKNVVSLLYGMHLWNQKDVSS